MPYFPLPDITDLLARLQKCNIFSSLGLRYRYFHIGLTPEAKLKTAPCSQVLAILNEFHSLKGHQWTSCMLVAIRRSYWWPKLWQDIIRYIGNCSVCAMKFTQHGKVSTKKHLKIPQIPMAVLAIDSKSHLPVMSKGNRWALTAICLYTLYFFTMWMNEKSAENVVHIYLSGILVQKDRNIVILSDNVGEFKNKVLNEACYQVDKIKRVFSNLFYPQGNARVENVHNFLKWMTFTKFLEPSNLDWDKHLPFGCYCYNILLGKQCHRISILPDVWMRSSRRMTNSS